MDMGIHSVADLAPYAFWDTDITNINLEKDKYAIISRIFEKGKLDDVLNTIVYYGTDVCSSVLTVNKYLSRPTVNLAHLLLSLPLEKFKAYASPGNNF